MTFGRLRHPNEIIGKPHRHLRRRLLDRLGVLEDPGVCNETQKRQKADPRQSDAGEPVELAIEPVARPTDAGVMMRRGRKSGCWRRSGSTKALALGDRQRLGHIVEARNAQTAKRD